MQQRGWRNQCAQACVWSNQSLCVAKERAGCQEKHVSLRVKEQEQQQQQQKSNCICLHLRSVTSGRDLLSLSYQNPPEWRESTITDSEPNVFQLSESHRHGVFLAARWQFFLFFFRPSRKTAAREVSFCALHIAQCCLPSPASVRCLLPRCTTQIREANKRTSAKPRFLRTDRPNSDWWGQKVGSLMTSSFIQTILLMSLLCHNGTQWNVPFLKRQPFWNSNENTLRVFYSQLMQLP